MSIEDIDYLLENSELNSLSIFIDSKHRDMLAFPTPSSYVVEFDHAIRNVYGVEILDATVPVTAYTIDSYTNSIGLTQLFNNTGIPIYDFNNSTSFVHNIKLLASCSAFDALFSANESANLFVCTNKTSYDALGTYDTSIQGSTNGIYYATSVPISLFPDVFTLSFVWTDGNTYYMNDSYVFDQYNRFGNTYEPNWSFAMSADANTMMYFEFKYCLDHTAQVYMEAFAHFDFLLVNSYLSIPIGNYTSDVLLSSLETLFLALNANAFIKVLPAGSIVLPAFSDRPIPGNSSITQVMMYTTGSSYPFFFDMKKSTSKYLLGFSENALSTSSKYNTFSYGVNACMFMSVQSSATSQTLETPGIINLESARYIILRCPEIESHLLGTYANFAHSPGIGLFKLLSSNSLMSLRFDFVNITRKPFHPIGKLPKLTIQFENSDGSIYDFRGIDHVLLLNIKYYAPKNVLRIPKSTLNPYYLPNVLEYQLKSYKDESIKKKLEKYTLEDILQEQKKYM